MNKQKVFDYLKIFVPVLFIISVSLFFYYYITPEELITFIGVENAYVMMFLVALIGCIGTFNGLPYFSILFVLANSGLNPLILGLASSLGVIVGDCVSYYIGYHGGAIVPKTFKHFFVILRELMHDYPRIFPFVCFLYGAISPFSNDFITIPSGLARYSFFRMIIPLALGNIVCTVTFSYLSIYFYDSVRLYFNF